MKFTKAQNDAIFTRDSNMLVSAGAGSGKTAVLSERVIQRLKEGVNIDEFIILTFTKAAAEEMKQRIKKKINNEPSLQHQLSKLDNAMISTFDSFCLRVVKTYGYLEGIPKDIHLTDSLLVETIKENVFLEVLEKFYNAEEGSFVSTLNILFDKGDQVLVNGLKKFIQSLERIPLPDSYLEEYQDHFYSDEFQQHLVVEFFKLLNDEIIDISNSFHAFQSEFEVNDDKVMTFFNTYKTIISDLSILKDNELLEYIQTITFPRRPSLKSEDDWNKAFAEAHDRFKNLLQNLKKKLKTLFIVNIEDIVYSYQLSKSSVLTFVNFAKEYFKQLEYSFQQNQIYDYHRIMNLAIKIFEKNESKLAEFKNGIQEIMIDEYQDTNDFQEYLMNLISNNNLFMVGDMKQSIYGFRNANPANFLKKYLSYDREGQGKVIVLDQNYRSRKEVLSDINLIFSSVMDERIGGINYYDRQALSFGRTSYDENQAEEYLSSVLLYNSQISKEKDKEFSASEHEAMIILNDIIHKVNTGYQVYDIEEGFMRKVTFKDFAILMDRKTSFDIYEKVFHQYGVPLLKVSDSSFSSEVEILTIHQLMRLILSLHDANYYKQYFKTSLYGVLRSFLFEFPDSFILELLTSFQGNLEVDRTILCEKVSDEFVSIIDDIYELSSHIPLIQLYETIINKFDMTSKMLSLENPIDSKRRIDHLYHVVSQLEHHNFHMLVDYLDRIYMDSDFDIEYSETIDFTVNKVKLLSIHKSKGLEFPICYYSGLSKKFNFQPDKSPVLFESTYGLYIPPYQQGFFDSVQKLLIDQKYIESFLSEQIRLFYVALTRAKEKMIFVIDESKIKTFSNYKDSHLVYLPSLRQKINSFSSLLSLIEPMMKRASQYQLTDETSPTSITVDKNVYIEKKHHKVYFESGILSSFHFSKEQYQLPSQEEKEAMHYGTEIHRIMEAFPWQFYIQALMLVDEKYRMFIKRFYDTFKDQISNSLTILQEYPFTYKIGDSIYRGMIDMIIIEEKDILVVDYKLNNIDDDQYINQVKGYMDYLSQYFPNHFIKGILYSLLSGEKKEVI